MAASNSTTSLQDRLRGLLKPLHDRLLEVFKYGPPTTVEPRSPSQPFLAGNADHFQALTNRGTSFFVFKTTSQPGTERMFGAGSLVSEKLQRAAMTYNRCREGAVALFPALEKIFGGDDEVEFVQQWRVEVKDPLLLLFKENELGKEKKLEHDFFFIATKDVDTSFVFDPTGYQFGFDDYFWTYEEYQKLIGFPRQIDRPVEEFKFHQDHFYKLLGSEQDSDTMQLGMVLDLRCHLEEHKTEDQLRRGDVW